PLGVVGGGGEEQQPGASIASGQKTKGHTQKKSSGPPPIYRIRHEHHYRTGDAWCVYPLYDFAHCLSDWIEGITHSICTLEFENNRELYDWVLSAVEVDNRPEQIEFARLNLTTTLMSKRKLLELVEGEHVS